MVRNSFLKKAGIPFAVLSTSSLFFGTSKTYAEEKGFIEGVLSLPKNLWNAGTDVINGVGKLVDILLSVVNWFWNLPENIAKLSVDLLITIYEFLMLILKTPLFIFNNSYIKDVSMVLSGASILIVTILTMFQGNKRMLKLKHDKTKEIYKRYSLAVLGSGIAPFLFEKSFELINLLTESITKIGSIEITPDALKECFKIDDVKQSLNIPDNSIEPPCMDSKSLTMTWVNTLLLLGFDIILLAMMIPIFLQNGRRFFDLMCLAAITPLALTAWIFDDWRHLFYKWWNNVKHLGLTPLVYAVFVVLLGLFIFGTRNIVSGGGLLIKFIIIIGGISRLADPPRFVKNKVDGGGNIIDSAKKTKKSFEGTFDTVTFKGLRNKITDYRESKSERTKELRRKHGKRNIKGL